MERSDVPGRSALRHFPLIGPLPSVPSSRSLEELLDSYVRNGWIHRDERYWGTPKLMREGVFTDFDFITDDQMRTHPYYQEFLGPFRSKAFVGVRIGNCCFSIQRTIEHGEYTEAELQTFRLLSSRLDGVAATAETLSYSRGDAALSAFELASHLRCSLIRSAPAPEKTERWQLKKRM